ncbi:hypothetical protein KW868_13625 [Acinetobacter guillouiae]|uniref:Uncharacterized protein n=1 Tax=Acinetobacter guillouiae TaxID=106649 RepID=A0A8X8GL89_ACIGI|nr:hypothetical protein [Acinetobacter guillouiae]MCF0265489.1 hypothetical protein [Acinetobacter guillouiae]
MKLNQTKGVFAEFGYYPKNIDIENDRFSIKALPNHADSVTLVTEDPNIFNNWIYPGNKENYNPMTRKTTLLPFSSRIFGLPKTHVLKLHDCENKEDIDFVVWCTSFFIGMRLTTTEAGFLDATPIKPNMLVDFVLIECSLEDVVNLTLDYLEAERNNFRATKRVIAVIHSLFLAQYPQSLSFERFQYLYMALDSCYQLVKAKSNPILKKDIPHKNRIEWMCNQFQIKVPDWALVIDKNSEISSQRNDAMHEALFFDEPLGFAIYENINGNVILQMQHLICRLLVAILGNPNVSYVKSSVKTRHKHGLNLKE